LELTRQQKDVAGISGPGVYIVDAVAGSGKTKAAMEYIIGHRHEKILYLVFNSRMRADVKEKLKFESHVDVHTQHSLCWKYTVGNKKSDFQKEFPRPRVGAVKAKWIVQTYDVFFETARFIEKLYGLYLTGRKSLDEVLQRFQFTTDTEWRMREIISDMEEAMKFGQCPMPHDFYVKWLSTHLFSLSLQYDTVILDEAQDTNPVMKDILDKIEKKKYILVGDSCQEIYEWRGAVSFMKMYKGHGREMDLSYSFRIGKGIAALAEVLSGKEVVGLGENRLVECPEEVTGIQETGDMKSFTFITRTNIRLFCFYVENRKLWKERTVFINNFQGQEIRDVLNLWEGKTYYIKDQFLKNFRNSEELVEYTRKLKEGYKGKKIDIKEKKKIDIAQEYSLLANLMDKYGVSAMSEALTQINTLAYEDSPDIRMMTIHTSKGMGFDNLLIDDYDSDLVDILFKGETLEEMGKNCLGVLQEEKDLVPDRNLLYVALTRASGRVYIGNERLRKLAMGVENGAGV